MSSDERNVKRHVLRLCVVSSLPLLGAVIATPAYAQAKKSSAGFMLDTNLSYFKGSQSAVTNESATNLYASAFVGAAMDRIWYIGWDTAYTSSQPTTAAGSQTITNIKLGPCFGLFLNTSHSLTMSASYYVYSKASYAATGATGASWFGGGYQAQLGYAPMISENLFMGIRLIYDASTFSTSTSSSTVTSVSYTKTNIFPAFAMTLRL